VDLEAKYRKFQMQSNVYTYRTGTCATECPPCPEDTRADDGGGCALAPGAFVALPGAVLLLLALLGIAARRD
jgi:hypothetical protein